MWPIDQLCIELGVLIFEATNVEFLFDVIVLNWKSFTFFLSTHFLLNKANCTFFGGKIRIFDRKNKIYLYEQSAFGSRQNSRESAFHKRRAVGRFYNGNCRWGPVPFPPNWNSCRASWSSPWHRQPHRVVRVAPIRCEQPRLKKRWYGFRLCE